MVLIKAMLLAWVARPSRIFGPEASQFLAFIPGGSQFLPVGSTTQLMQALLREGKHGIQRCKRAVMLSQIADVRFVQGNTDQFWPSPVFAKSSSCKQISAESVERLPRSCKSI